MSDNMKRDARIENQKAEIDSPANYRENPNPCSGALPDLSVPNPSPDVQRAIVRRSVRLENHIINFRLSDDDDTDASRKKKERSADASRKRKERSATSEHDANHRRYLAAERLAKSRSQANHLLNIDVEHAPINRMAGSQSQANYLLNIDANRVPAAVNRVAEKRPRDAVPTETETDAKRYYAQLQNTCVFYLCCTCAYEAGTQEMYLINQEIKTSLSQSELKFKFDALMAEDSAFSQCAGTELESPGVLKNINHICKTCAEAAKKGSINPRALVNGFYCGVVPSELSCLNSTELSMISRINPITQIDLIKGGPNSSVNSVSYTNDVIDIARQLPNLNGKAVLRDRKSQTHYFRPKEVRAALLWLKTNNPLYADVQLVFPAGWSDRVVQLDSTTMEFNDNDAATITDVEAEKEHESATNTAAVAPDHIYIANYDTSASVLHVLQQVVESECNRVENNSGIDALPDTIAPEIIPVSASRNRMIVERSAGEKVEPHKIKYFDALAFPQLYPYGKGCDHVLNHNYIKHRLMCGGNHRRFSENLLWLFTHYGYEVRKKNGAVSALSDKITQARDKISKNDSDDLRSFLTDGGVTDASKMARIRKLLTYVAPFSGSIPGSQLYMEQEKSKMKSFVNSPLTCANAHWRWFFTTAQSDLFNPIIFDNLMAPSVSYSNDVERSNASDALPKDKRATMIRQNPVMPVRVWTLQQDAFFDQIINGSAKPLGDEVLDFIEKIEFQFKGTIHSHYMCCVRDHEFNDSYFNIIDDASKSKMQEIVDKVVTAKLLGSESIDGFSWEWYPLHPFDDAHQPERQRFDPELNYELHQSSVPKSAIVGLKVQQLQISSYMHRCRQQCFKYCAHKPRRLWKCRYEFPVQKTIQCCNSEIFCHDSDVAQVLIDKDQKSRTRLRVLPARNNSHLAPSPKSPLMTLAAGGNTNLQFLTNKYGAVEYTTSYIGKVDMPETKIVINTITKLLGMGDEHHRNVLKAVLNGLSNGRRVSSTEAALYFLQHRVVDYSRTIKVINPKPIQNVNMNIDLDASADVDTSESGLKETSQHSVRKDYAIFLKKQIQMHGRCEVSFYSFITSFRCTTITKKKHNAVPLFQVDICTGAVINVISFDCGNRHFIGHKKPAIVHYRPYLRIDDSEESYRSLLLMYISWPEGDESKIVAANDTAVATWKRLKEEDNVPLFALHFIERDMHRQGLSIGCPNADNVEKPHSDGDINDRHYDGDEVDGIDASIDHDNSVESHADAPTFEITNTSGVHFSVPHQHIKEAKAYVSKMKEDLLRDSQSKYVMTLDELHRKNADPEYFIPVDKQEILERLLTIAEETLVDEQRQVYDEITSHILDPERGQLISFVTGEGGTGKSKIISTVKMWADAVFGKQEGDFGSCLLCAPTGPAAFNINGQTWQSAFGHSVEGGHIKTTEDVKNERMLRQKFRGLRIMILDEISMIGANALWEMHIRLQVACDDDNRKSKPFGGYHVLIFGVTLTFYFAYFVINTNTGFLSTASCRRF
jgi:hypothetical protein